MITKGCRDCEDWQMKDMVYVVGFASSGSLKSLWFVYGDCYAANKEIYTRVKEKISLGVNELQGVEFSNTRELARVNRIDPLGITYLRVRGMWGIVNPMQVFDYVVDRNKQSDFTAYAIMLKSKYDSFSKEDRGNIERIADKEIIIKDIQIKSPNNPAKLLDAKLFKFES